jgi:hypothetical protein
LKAKTWIALLVVVCAGAALIPMLPKPADPFLEPVEKPPIEDTQRPDAGRHVENPPRAWDHSGPTPGNTCGPMPGDTAGVTIRSLSLESNGTLLQLSKDRLGLAVLQIRDGQGRWWAIPVDNLPAIAQRYHTRGPTPGDKKGPTPGDKKGPTPGDKGELGLLEKGDKE